MKKKREEVQSEAINNYLTLGCLLLLCFLFCFEIKDIMFTTHDEVNNYLRTNGDLWGTVVGTAKGQGRFYMLFSLLVASIPFWSDSLLWYKCWSVGAVLLNAFVIGKVVKKRVGLQEALLVLLFFFSLYELNDQHNLVISYPFFLQMPFIFLVLSIEFFLQYLESNNLKKSIVSAALLFLACMFNEGFLLTIGVFFILSLKSWKFNWTVVKEVLQRTKLHLLLTIIYFVIYIVFRICFPSTYTGNVPDNADILGSLKTMIALAFGQAPLRSFFRLTDKSALVVTAESILKFAFATMGTYLILRKLSKEKKKNQQQKIKGICFLLMVILVFPHSLTSKYVTWINSGAFYSYTVSYYSFWCLMIIVAILVAEFMKEVRKNCRIVCGIFSVIVGILAFITQLNNQYYADFFEERADYYNLWLDFVESEYVESLPSDTIVVCDGYAGVHSNLNLDRDYINYMYQKKITLVNSQDAFIQGKNYYFMKLDKEDNVVFFGKINEKYETDKIIVYSNQSLDNCSLMLEVGELSEITVGNVLQGHYTGDAVVPLNTSEECATVLVTNTDMRKLKLIDGSIEGNRAFYLDYGRNCYTQEAGWRWLNNHAQLRVVNELPYSVDINMTFSISTSEVSGEIEMQAGEETYYITAGPEGAIFSEIISVPAGGIDLTFTTSAGPVYAPNDNRELYMCLRNVSLQNPVNRVE